MEALPVEGGLFVQSYKSPETIARAHLPKRYPTSRPYATAIVYLLTGDPDSFSALHKLPTDEVYHFYLGDPVELLQLYPDGAGRRVLLGQDILNGQAVQYTAPRQVWQGSHLVPGGSLALIGTTMGPGFSEDDYFGGDRDELIAQYPEWADLIRSLTRPLEPGRRMISG
jgi:predicted cupin superfamily sugar epimerase